MKHLDFQVVRILLVFVKIIPISTLFRDGHENVLWGKYVKIVSYETSRNKLITYMCSNIWGVPKHFSSKKRICLGTVHSRVVLCIWGRGSPRPPFDLSLQKRKMYRPSLRHRLGWLRIELIPTVSWNERHCIHLRDPPGPTRLRQTVLFPVPVLFRECVEFLSRPVRLKKLVCVRGPLA